MWDPLQSEEQLVLSIIYLDLTEQLWQGGRDVLRVLRQGDGRHRQVLRLLRQGDERRSRPRPGSRVPARPRARPRTGGGSPAPAYGGGPLRSRGGPGAAHYDDPQGGRARTRPGTEAAPEPAPGTEAPSPFPEEPLPAAEPKEGRKRAVIITGVVVLAVVAAVLAFVLTRNEGRGNCRGRCRIVQRKQRDVPRRSTAHGILRERWG